MSATRRARPAAPRLDVAPAARAVLLVGTERDWPEIRVSLRAGGYVAGTVEDLSLVPSRLAGGAVGALFVCARPLGASELLALRRVREDSPRTAIVVVTRNPTDPDVKRAFESGATAFLSWPATPDSLRHAIESGDAPSPQGARLRS
jgi:DNA-binding NarL/FixJ family response regulator